MTYRAQFTNNAKEDFIELKAYVVQAWSKQVWKTAFEQIKHAVSIIESQPHAGAVCQDLAQLGITTYRQMLTNKNRIIYEIDSTNKLIFIHIVCDQKRDLQTLLIHRLLHMSALNAPALAAPPATM